MPRRFPIHIGKYEALCAMLSSVHHGATSASPISTTTSVCVSTIPETMGSLRDSTCMVIGVGKIIVVEAVRLEVVGDKAQGISTNDDVATRGYIGTGGIADGLLVDKRVFGEDDITELTTAIIDREIDVGIGVFLAHDTFEFAKCEVLVVLIDLDFLQADDISILTQEVLNDPVARCFLELAHTMGVIGENLQTVVVIRLVGTGAVRDEG